jgi:hypothetical protein
VKQTNTKKKKTLHTSIYFTQYEVSRKSLFIIHTFPFLHILFITVAYCKL